MRNVWEHASSAVYDPLLSIAERRGIARPRTRLLREATGPVLELGAGTGLDLRHHPDSLESLLEAVERDRWSWMPVLAHPLAIGRADVA